MARMVFISHSSKDKDIVDEICNHLESAGIPCWIAPRDITTSDWADSIMDGLHRSDVFVVVISENSIPSQEVLKEVTEATKTCSYLLPFRIDDEVLSNRLQYHLGPCQWINAYTPPVEKWINELTERILNLSEKDAIYLNNERMKLVSRPVYPSRLFIGREGEIASIAEAFEEDHVVFLQGMGGIGKSEIAKGYAKEHADEYDTVIFTSYVSGIMDHFCSDEITITNLRRTEGEDQEKWFARKLDIFRSLATERTLLVIDNYDTDEDENLEELFSSKCRILITTRNDHSDYTTIQVGPIDDFNAVRKIFTSNYGRPVKPDDQETVDQILRLVGCHTITVELIAKQMKASFLKPAKMLDRLQNTGINTHLKEKIRRDGSSSNLNSFDYIRQLFSFSGLSDEEKHLLSVMSLVPVTGISVEMLGEILDLDDFDPVNSLINKSWLMLDEDDELFLHPIIKDVVKEDLSPTPDSCIDYIHGLDRKSHSMWFSPLEERNAIFSLVKQIMIDWPVPTEATLQSYLYFINALWMGSDFKASQKAGQGVYDYTLENCGNDSTDTGLAALYTAGAHHNAGDDLSAEPWYRKAYEHFKAMGGPVTAGLAQACFKTGRCAVRRRDAAAAQPYFDQAELYFNDLIQRNIVLPGQLYPDQYIDFVDDLSALERLKGNYEKAIELGHRCLELYRKNFGGEDNVSFTYAYLSLGRSYIAIGDYDMADKYLQKALEIDLKYLGVASLETVYCREVMADSALARGDREKAETLYTNLEMDLEKYFGELNPTTVRIREKREKVSSDHTDSLQ